MSPLPWLLAEYRKQRRMPCRICHRAPPGGSPAPSCPWLRGRGAAPCLCLWWCADCVVSGHPGQPRVIVTRGQSSSDLYRPPAHVSSQFSPRRTFSARQGYTQPRGKLFFGQIILTNDDRNKIDIDLKKYFYGVRKNYHSTFRHPWSWPLLLQKEIKMKRLQFFALLLGGERNCFLCAPSVRPSPPVSHWDASSLPIGCWPLSSASDWMALTRREVSSDGKLQVNTPGQKMFWVFIKIISAQLECVKWEYFRSMSLSLSIMSISSLQLFPPTIREMRWLWGTLWCIRLKRQIQKD